MVTEPRDDREVVKAGARALKDRVPNRELSVEAYAEWRRWLRVAREDERVMYEWKERGFVSGDPGDRPLVRDDAYEAGGEYACEHGYGGRHTVNGAESACHLLRPNMEDWFLTPRRTPSRLPGEAPVAPYPYLEGRPADDAELDSLAALMREPYVHEGGGTTGLEDAYHVARARMSLPVGALSVKGGADAPNDS